MKSSSELFTVSLIRAELAGSYNEDTYLIKHNKAEDDSVQIAVTRVALADHPPTNNIPIVLVHDLFQNRSSWMDGEGNGLAGYLVGNGFDVWMLEHRGHGLSPFNRDYINNDSESYITYDYPAVEQFIEEQTGHKPNWIGHGYGGAYVMAAKAAGTITNTKDCKVTLLGSQAFKTNIRAWLIPFYYTFSLLGTKTERWQGPGPEFEPRGIRRERIWWRSLLGSWRGKRSGISYIRNLPELKGQALIFAGGDDKLSPFRRCKKWLKHLTNMNVDLHLLSPKMGYKHNYNHQDLVNRLEGESEFWPEIKNFFK